MLHKTFSANCYRYVIYRLLYILVKIRSRDPPALQVLARN